MNVKLLKYCDDSIIYEWSCLEDALKYAETKKKLNASTFDDMYFRVSGNCENYSVSHFIDVFSDTKNMSNVNNGENYQIDIPGITISISLDAKYNDMKLTLDMLTELTEQRKPPVMVNSNTYKYVDDQPIGNSNC